MEHAKNYEIRCKIIWNIRTKRVAPFSGQCNLRFLSTKVLQGSVGTCVNYGRIFIDFFTANLLQSVVVKEFWKSVRISRSYRQKYSGTFFSGHGVFKKQLNCTKVDNHNVKAINKNRLSITSMPISRRLEIKQLAESNANAKSDTRRIN